MDEEYSLESTSISKDSAGDYELDFTDIDSDGFSVTASFNDFCEKVLNEV